MKLLFIIISLCLLGSITLVFSADVSIQHDESFSILKHRVRAVIVKSGKADISIKITGKKKNEENIITYHCLTPDANRAHPWHNEYLKLEKDLATKDGPHMAGKFILYHLKVDGSGDLVGQHVNLEKFLTQIRLQAKAQKICVVLEISDETKISSIVGILNKVSPFCAERFIFIDAQREVGKGSGKQERVSNCLLNKN